MAEQNRVRFIGIERAIGLLGHRNALHLSPTIEAKRAVWRNIHAAANADQALLGAKRKRQMVGVTRMHGTVIALLRGPVQALLAHVITIY